MRHGLCFELSVLRGHFDTEALAERSNITAIILIKLISSVKLHHPLRRYTPDRVPVHRPSPGERFGWVLDSVNMITFRIECIGVNVYLTAQVIPQDKVTISRIVTWHIFESSRFK